VMAGSVMVSSPPKTVKSNNFIDSSVAKPEVLLSQYASVLETISPPSREKGLSWVARVIRTPDDSEIADLSEMYADGFALLMQSNT
jgi:hypothetical protein